MTTEKRVSEAARTPEERKLEDAFERFKPELLGTLLHLLGNLEDANDAFQDAFVHCWRTRSQVDEIVNLRAWIFRIAYNVGVDSLKSGWKQRKKNVAVEELTPVSREKLPEDVFAKNERVAVLRAAIRKLDEREREIFLLRQNGELTYEQIAQTIEMPVGTVKTKMRRALAKLRAAVERNEVETAEKNADETANETNGDDSQRIDLEKMQATSEKNALKSAISVASEAKQ